MTDTRDKLNEAAYFLEQMKGNVENKEAFRFNLSAFMSALRSTTLFMQAEYTHTPGFLTWYATKQPEMERDKILKFFNKQRTQTIHIKSIATQSQVHFYSPAIDLRKFTGEKRVSFNITSSVTESGKPEMQVHSIDDPDNAVVGEPSYEVKWLFDDLPENDNPQQLDIVTLSLQQLAKISALVVECEQAFSI